MPWDSIISATIRPSNARLSWASTLYNTASPHYLSSSIDREIPMATYRKYHHYSRKYTRIEIVRPAFFSLVTNTQLSFLLLRDHHGSFPSLPLKCAFYGAWTHCRDFPPMLLSWNCHHSFGAFGGRFHKPSPSSRVCRPRHA